MERLPGKLCQAKIAIRDLAPTQVLLMATKYLSTCFSKLKFTGIQLCSNTVKQFDSRSFSVGVEM